MTPNQLRIANLEHFRRLLERTTDSAERARIMGLIDEERLKPDGAYPSSSQQGRSKPPTG